MYTINITDKQEIQFHEFRQEHAHEDFNSTIGGKFSFIITPTGLGPIIEVKCNACGEIKDITDDECFG